MIYCGGGGWWWWDEGKRWSSKEMEGRSDGVVVGSGTKRFT